MRLTKKSKYSQYEPTKPSVLYPAIDKLGQLEDFEEELGIDLATLFKALRNGFYHLDSCYEDITSPLTQSEFDLLLREVSE